MNGLPDKRPRAFASFARVLLTVALTTALAIAAADHAFVLEAAEAGGARLVGLLLTWQRDPTTTMTIDWHLAPAQSSAHDSAKTPLPPPRLVYRAEGAQEWTAAEGAVVDVPVMPGRTIYRLELTGLAPATSYQFRLEGVNRTFSFRTMPQALDRPLRFAIGGDTLHEQVMMERTSRAVAAFNPEFIVWGGDLAYANGVDAYRWEFWFDAILNTLIDDDGRVIPVLAGIGNHETRSSVPTSSEPTDEEREAKAPFYYRLIAFPGHPGYGALDFGDYLSFIFLDSGHTNPITGVQTRWLEEALAARADRPHVFPVYHVPAYPSTRAFEYSASRSVREWWVPLFEKYGLRFAFENHDHAYKRTVPIRDGREDARGVIYIGDGAWGVETRDHHPVDATWYLETARRARHAVIVTLVGDETQFVAVDEFGNVFDALSVNGIAVESPDPVMAATLDTPIAVSLPPGTRPVDVNIALNDTLIYHGSDLPQDLRLSSAADLVTEGTNRLWVEVADDTGLRRYHTSRFEVRRAVIGSFGHGPFAGEVPLLRGRAPVRFTANLSAGEELARARVSLVPTRPDDPEGEIVLHDSGEAPGEILLDTLALADGTYDLIFALETARGVYSEDVQRVTVRNWEVLIDPLQPPVSAGWFGVLDRLKVKERSGGWSFASADAGAFFGDGDRLAASGAEEYLTWEMPHLRRFYFTVYVDGKPGGDPASGSESAAALVRAAVAIDVSADGSDWRAADYDVTTTDRSETGRLRLELEGELPDDTGARFVRLTLRSGDASGLGIQLGDAVITGAYQP